MYDVIIVGYGPVGAMLAALLGERGRKVLVVERDTSIYPLPRAVHMDHEVFRLLSLVRADRAVAQISRPTVSYDFETATGELLMGFAPPDACAPTGYPWSNIFHQPTLERALRDQVACFPNVDVRLGTEFISYDDSNEDEVSVTLNKADGSSERETVRARYLVGCDGGKSPVRRQAGIGMDDLDFNEPWAVVDVLLPNTDMELHAASRQICDPARPVTSIPIGHGRHRWEFMLLTDEDPESMNDPAKLTPLIEAQLPEGVPISDIEIERSAVYTFHGVFAKAWRQGRVLLAGDAAHQMPPFMGQGLCSGVRDAANIAWKLDAVLTGDAQDALLDTLQPEREPQVRFITEVAIGMGRVVCTQNPEEARARDEEMLANAEAAASGNVPALPPVDAGVSVSPSAGEPMAKDGDLDAATGYRPLLVLKEKGNMPCKIKTSAVPGLHIARMGQPFLLEDKDGQIAAQLGDAEAMLVRPDKLIFGTGQAEQLLEQYSTYLQTGEVA